VIEKELSPFQARPHWGKLFTMSPQQLQSHYKRLPEFIALTKKFDPQGKFRNAFLDTNIFT
jgi:alditol oxidase